MKASGPKFGVRCVCVYWLASLWPLDNQVESVHTTCVEGVWGQVGLLPGRGFASHKHKQRKEKFCRVEQSQVKVTMMEQKLREEQTASFDTFRALLASVLQRGQVASQTESRKLHGVEKGKVKECHHSHPLCLPGQHI